MGKRIALTQCINPSHNDSTPSMAVYDHGEDKLQVFCFGCKYHAWVDPIDIDLTQPTRQTGTVTHDDIITEYDYAKTKELIRDYFNKRNLNDEIIDQYLYNCGSGFDGRPYMSWSIYDYNGKYTGWQRRYLDDAHPKTKYNSGIEIDNKHVLYYTSLIGDLQSREDYYDVVITESAFDSFWVKKSITEKKDTIYYTTLGTPDDVNWEYNVRSILINASDVYLYFDRDIPGYKTVQAILKWWEYNVSSLGDYDLPIDMMVNMPEGSAVYDYIQG